ncbi:MAG: hypothetical protein ABW321_00295 [Polyangiales bacterium]
MVVGSACDGCKGAKPQGPAAAPAPAPAPVVDQAALNHVLRAVWGSSASDVWAVGNDGALLHYDGHAWSAARSDTTSHLTGVSGTAADDVWAVGENGAVLHYDGRVWRVLDDARDGVTLLTVSSLSRSDVWVAGLSDNAAIVRRYHDGAVAETQALPGSTGIWRAWPVSPTDMWFVGSDRQANSFIMHLQDGKWEHRPLRGGPMRAVFGVASNDVWAGAYDGSLHHWDGNKWEKASTTIEGAHWLGLWGSSTTDIWAYGVGGVLGHYDGKTWTPVKAAANTVWGAWGSGPDDIWFVGRAETVGTRLHWNGKTLE